MFAASVSFVLLGFTILLLISVAPVMMELGSSRVRPDRPLTKKSKKYTEMFSDEEDDSALAEDPVPLDSEVLAAPGHTLAANRDLVIVPMEPSAMAADLGGRSYGGRTTSEGSGSKLTLTELYRLMISEDMDDPAFIISDSPDSFLDDPVEEMEDREVKPITSRVN